MNDLAMQAALPTAALHKLAELIVSDGLCPKIAQLDAGARHELMPVGFSANPLQQIGDALALRRRQGRAVSTLHLVAHGRHGAIQLGGQWIDTATLIANAAVLADWQVTNVNLWSCEVGKNNAFQAVLGELTGARIAATQQIINRAPSSWLLRDQLSESSALDSVFSSGVLQKWDGSLATVTFPKAFKSATNQQTWQQQDITLEASNSLASATSITFTSQNPADVNYSGNNVPGTLSYTVGGTTTSLKGYISRPDKTANAADAFYFHDSNGDFTTGPGDTGFAYLLVTTNSKKTYSAGGTATTSSDPVDAFLNKYLGNLWTNVT